MTDSTRQKWIDAGLEDSYQELLDRDGISKSECWSLEQKEAIRNRFALITQKVFTYGCLTGRGDALSVKQEEYIDKGLWVDELMAELEAITKGEE